MAKYKIIPSTRTIVQSPISIGHKAEKGVEAIEFDVTAWVETYGSGTLTVIMRRWGDAIPYPIALEIDENNKATWTLSDTDTAKAGMAYAQLSYVVGETVVKKSDIYTFRVMDSLTGEGEPPEAYESWLEHLTHLAAEAMAEVLDIEGIVTDKTLTVDGGIADGKATGDALALKADKSTTYTKTEVDALIDEVEVETDTTLTISGAPADAAETGRQFGLIKADLGDLSDLETESKTDLVSAINEASKSGLSDAAKEAIIACFESIAIWGDGKGREHIERLSDALYSVGGVFKWRASTRTLPSEMTYSDAVLVDDTYYEITEPKLQLGLSKTGGVIEIEMSLETTASVSSSLGIFAAATPWKGTKLLFLNGDIVVSNVDEQGASDNLVLQDVDITQFHKYKLAFDKTHTDIYIDGTYIGRVRQYEKYFMRPPIFGKSGNNDKIRLKSIDYRYNAPLDQMFCKIYKGVGISSDLSGFIANSARCISDIYYFNKNNAYFYLDVDIEEGVQYAIKPIDENGNIWAYDAAVDEYNVGYMDSNGTPLSNGWITSPGRVSIYAYKTGDTTTRVKLPNTNGSLRILFKKADGTDFTEVPTCTFYLAEDGTVVATEEGDANEIL